MSKGDGTQNVYLPRHYRELLEQLNLAHVAYMLIGGYAVGTYGHVRATGDLDIFINATPENAQRMMQACVNYGIDPDSLSLDMFLVPRMVAIGQAPLRIEVLKKLDAVDFQYAYPRSKKVAIDGITVPVVSLDDLILLKAAATQGRQEPRDQEDLSFLKKLKATLGRSRKTGRST